MDDALLVGSGERVGDLARDAERVVERHPRRRARDVIRERLAVHDLEHEEPRPTRFLEAVNARDVRMIERGENLRFALEPRDAIVILRECLGEDLQRDVTIEFRIAGAVDLAHTAGAERRDDLVGSKTSAAR